MVAEQMELHSLEVAVEAIPGICPGVGQGEQAFYPVL